LASPLRKEIGGATMAHDRLWQVTAPNFVAGFTEYNDEITGCAPILSKWCRYSARANYVISQFRAKGWKVEHVEDRRG